MDKQTSDERLLKIIEGNSESRRTQATMPLVKRPSAPASAFKFKSAGLKNILKNFKINLMTINIGLMGLGIILTLIFIYIFFSGDKISKSNAAYFTPADSAAIVKFISVGDTQKAVRKTVDSESLKRNFFLPADLKVGTITAQESVAVSEVLKDFKLVGIIWSQNPEVMIENAKDSRTYSFKKGESFNEQFKVKEILRNSTILEVNLGSGTREYELR